MGLIVHRVYSPIIVRQNHTNYRLKSCGLLIKSDKTVTGEHFRPSRLRFKCWSDLTHHEKMVPPEQTRTPNIETNIAADQVKVTPRPPDLNSAAASWNHSDPRTFFRFNLTQLVILCVRNSKRLYDWTLGVFRPSVELRCKTLNFPIFSWWQSLRQSH